jgi:hypothetical protein
MMPSSLPASWRLQEIRGIRKIRGCFLLLEYSSMATDQTDTILESTLLERAARRSGGGQSAWRGGKDNGSCKRQKRDVSLPNGKPAIVLVV